MAATNRRVPPSQGDDWLYKRIEELERKLDAILNRAYPQVPIYDYDGLPDNPIEGQIAIIVNAPDVVLGDASALPTGPAGGALVGTYPNPGLNASVAGAGLTETSDVLSVNVDNSTIEINSDTLRVKADGIGSSQIAADAVGSSEIAANAVGTSELASTAVTPGTYGDATHVPQIIVDVDGRLTSAADVLITGTGGGGSSSHILLADGRSTPFAFTDLLQMDDGSDFMWSDPE